jgi:hypothetical protein
VPHRVQKPPVIFRGQKLVVPTAAQRVPVCDSCNELAATYADVHSELAPDKWWKWFSYPRFLCQPEALMGCEMHRVQPEIRFHDGRVQLFIELPLTRWQRLKEWPAVVLALIFALILKLFHL